MRMIKKVVLFHKKKRNRYLAPDTRPETLDEDFPEHFTKRLALKLNHSIFDPAKLLQAWILKLRLAFRDILFYERENYPDLSSKELWDMKLPDKFREQWLKLTKEMFELEKLEFPRSIVPKSYDPDTLPTLVMFSDGSDLGQCTSAYLVWPMRVAANGAACVSGMRF